MKKLAKCIFIANIIAITMSSTAFSGTWEQNQNGWYWEDKEGLYPASTWMWLDGNQDGIAENYYFDEQGYLMTDTEITGGYQVDAEGRWIVDGVIQTRVKGRESIELNQIYADALEKSNSLDSYAAAVNLETGMSTVDMNLKFKDRAAAECLMDVEVAYGGATIGT